MKKQLLLSLIFLTSISGCGLNDKSIPLNYDETKQFFESKEAINNYSFKFTIKYKYNYKRINYNQNITMNIKGEFDFNEKYNNFHFDASINSKNIYYNDNGKQSEKSKITTEVTSLSLYNTENKQFENSTYIYTKIKASNNNKNINEKIKEKVSLYNDSTFNEYLEMLENANDFETIYSPNILVYVNGDDCMIVDSTYQYHSEIKIYFNGKKLNKIKYTIVSANEELEYVINYCKVKEIKAPRDSENYK